MIDRIIDFSKPIRILCPIKRNFVRKVLEFFGKPVEFFEEVEGYEIKETT